MIRLLPLDVRAHLRSGVAAPCIAQCVEELVLNSVDAQATCIAVRVDIPNCKIQVVDNGKGLTRENFDLIGHRYATSKCQQLEDLDNLVGFGYRGEALASIRYISRVLEIVSRAEGSHVTLTKLFKDGKSEVFEVSRKRPSIGTTVTAHNLFYNLPVRRRMVSDSLDYERICQRLEGLALIHPHVSFSLRNDSTRTKSVQTFKTSSVLNTFRFLFGEPKAKCLKEVTHQHGKFTVSGYVGVEGHPNKDLQFLYVNSRLVLKTKLHKAINCLLRKSLIARCRYSSETETSVTTDVTDSPCNAADQYGIFVLNIKCSCSEYDICLEPAKSLVEFKDWHGILNCIEQLVNHFLTRENLTMRIDKHRDQNSPSDKCSTVLCDDSSQDQDTDSENCEAAEGSAHASLSYKYGKGISASSCSNTLKSLTVRRTHCKPTGETVSTNMPMEDSSSCQGCEHLDTSVPDLEGKSSRLEMRDKMFPEADVGKAKFTPKVKESQVFDSDCVEHSEVRESTGNREMTSLVRQQHLLPSSTVTNMRLKHFQSSDRLDRLLTENEVKAKRQISVSDSFCRAAPLERDIEPVEMPLESEGTEHASDSQQSSESEDKSSVDQAVLCLGFDACDSASRLTTADLNTAWDSPNEMSSNTKTCLQLNKAYDTPSDKTSLACPLRESEIVHPSSESNDEKTCTSSHNGNRKTVGSDSHRNCLKSTCSSPLITSSFTSMIQERDGIECDSQFITPKMSTPKLEGGKGRSRQLHMSSSSSDASGFDSENEISTSNLSPLLEKYELSLSSESTTSKSFDNGRKDLWQYSEKACHKIAEGKPVQHFIALKPEIVDRDQSTRSTTPSLYSKYLGRPTSSLQTFKKSVQAKAFSSKSCRHWVSGLLSEKDKTDSCEVNGRKQSAHFTTASPVLLKRKFSEGLPEKDATEKDTPVHTSTYGITDPEDVLKEKSYFDFADNTEATSLVGCPKRPKSYNQTGCATDNFESHEGKDIRHNTVPQLPNLKRLKQMSVSPMLTSSTTEPPKGIVNSPDQESRICETATHEIEPPTKRFMTSDGFILQRNASTKEPVPERRLYTDVELFLHVHTAPGCLRDPPVLKRDKQAEPTDTHACESNMFRSRTKSQEGNVWSPASDSEEKSCAVLIQVQETSSSQEKLVYGRSNDHRQVQSEDGCRSVDEDKNAVLPLESFPTVRPASILHSESALEKSLDSSPCQVLPQNSLSRSSESLPITPEDLDSDNLKLMQTKLIDPRHFLARMSPLAESGFAEPTAVESSQSPFDDDEKLRLPILTEDLESDSLRVTETELLDPRYSVTRCTPLLEESVISELTKTGCTQFPLEDDKPEFVLLDGDTTLAPIQNLCKNLDSPCDLEANSVNCVCESAPVLHNQDNNSVDSDKPTQGHSADFVEHQTDMHTLTDGKDVHVNLNDPIQNGEPSVEDKATCRPAVFTDTFGKLWTSHFDPKSRKEVYVDLTTGNCRLEVPPIQKRGTSEGELSQEDGIDVDNPPSVLIVPTGRKLSHLHRTHALCAQPFLSVSTGRRDVLSRPPSCHDLSPSSHSALLHMVDDHIDQQDGEIASKWRGNEPSKQRAGNSAADGLLNNWTNPMFLSLEADILDAKSSHTLRSCVWTQNTVNPCKFTKAMFQRIKVLGQVDNKFIACMVSTDEDKQAAQANLLLMVDQHAAHERVRLEQLVSDVTDVPTTDDVDCRSDVAEQPVMKSSAVVPPITLSMTDKELRLLKGFSHKVERLGIAYCITDEDESCGTGSRVEITRLPSCLVEREVAEVSRNRQPVASSLVQALLEEYLHQLQRTAGASAVLPKTVTRILNSQACHGAIKFGDPMSHSQCLSLISQLSQCHLPFQCAHGRPSVIPLFDLKLLASTVYDKADELKPRLWHLRGKMEKMEKGCS